MIKKIILLAVGLVVFGLGCAMIVNVREWLSLWPEADDAGWICFWIKFMIAIVANYLTMSIFLNALRSGANDSEDINSNQELTTESSSSKKNMKIYRHSRIKIYMYFSISVALSMGVLLLIDPKKQAIALHHVIGFSLSMFFLASAVYANIFCVEVGPDKIIIRDLEAEEIVVKDIIKINCTSIRGFRIIMITLNNGRVCSIGGRLKNYRELVDTLKTYVLKNGGRWFLG